eukprot:1674087-Ditylum_brightwellii.AAC.1
MGKVVTAVVVELRAVHRRLLILPCVVKSLMVELEAGCHILFILPGVQEVKKEMIIAMEEVWVVHPRPSILRLGCLPQKQVMVGVKTMGVVGLVVSLLR